MRVHGGGKGGRGKENLEGKNGGGMNDRATTEGDNEIQKAPAKKKKEKEKRKTYRNQWGW